MAELISMRKAYGEALVRVGEQFPQVVALSADVSNSDFSYMFQEKYPERFFNVGIAEQSLVDVAAGLAYSGKIPFANTFAFLFATRALEMVRTHLCYGQANVKLMGAYAGISDSFDGPTHHSISDIAILRSLPNMTIVVPSDAIAVARLLPQIAEWNGPVYCRMNRNEVPTLFDESYAPQIGKAVVIRPGNDATIIACGLMLSRSLQAAEILSQQGLSARVVEMHTIKPIDREAIETAARETGALVTAEEHTVIGGLGAAVCEVVAECCPVPVKLVGLPDCFAETGPYSMILDKYGMSVEHIVQAAIAACKMKKIDPMKAGLVICGPDVAYDLFHMNIEDESIEGGLCAAGERLWHVHIADTNRKYPGSGHMNYQGIFDTLKGMRYAGYVSAELRLGSADTLGTMIGGIAGP